MKRKVECESVRGLEHATWLHTFPRSSRMLDVGIVPQVNGTYSLNWSRLAGAELQVNLKVSA